MSKKLFIGGIILIITWLIGFWGLHATPTIHILLIASIIVFLISLLYNKAFMR